MHSEANYSKNNSCCFRYSTMEKRNEFWFNFQSFVEESIPSAIVNVLIDSGFDNILAMTEINQDDLADIERSVGKILLPGHKKFIVALGKKAKEYELSLEKSKKKGELEFSDGTFIIKDLVKTTIRNANLVPS